jgi:hypothetical protein
MSRKSVGAIGPLLMELTRVEARIEELMQEEQKRFEGGWQPLPDP